MKGRYDLYHVELRPWLWHLTLGADCRIFQNKSALEIITSVFAEYKSATAVEDKVSPKPAKRPFTVQYRESDYNFVSRLMEEEGIYYYFKHANAQHTLVLCNSPSGHSNVEGTVLHWSAKKTDRLKANNIITQWTRTHSLRSLKYSHTDFAAEAPATSLLASAKRTANYGEPNDLEVYDYPGGHDDMAMGTNTGGKQPEGERTAKLRVNAFESGHSVAAGITAFRPLAVGHTFKFENPPVEADKLDYLVTSSIFEMEVGGDEADKDKETLTTTNYTCRFDAVPKAVAFQPRRVAQAPLVHGPQTATVVGPSGDEIHTDKYGRVKVKFHWDRDDKKNETSSCFVRVSQPWASKQFGMMALPRIGDEVVVEFLEGNPDRPLITGRVYNGTTCRPGPAGPRHRQRHQDALQQGRRCRQRERAALRGREEQGVHLAAGREGLPPLGEERFLRHRQPRSLDRHRSQLAAQRDREVRDGGRQDGDTQDRRGRECHARRRLQPCGDRSARGQDRRRDRGQGGQGGRTDGRRGARR